MSRSKPRTEKEISNMNNPLQSLLNRDYISEKLNAHRQIIDSFGSKVPTPVIKDVYKQCSNNDISRAKEAVGPAEKAAEKEDVVTSDFTEQKMQSEAQEDDTGKSKGVTLILQAV